MKQKPLETLHDQITPALWLSCLTRLTAAMIIDSPSDYILKEAADKAAGILRQMLCEMPFGFGWSFPGSLRGKHFPYLEKVGGESWAEAIFDEPFNEHFGVVMINGGQCSDISVGFQGASPERFVKVFPHSEIPEARRTKYKSGKPDGFTHSVDVRNAVAWLGTVGIHTGD